MNERVAEFLVQWVYGYSAAALVIVPSAIIWPDVLAPDRSMLWPPLGMALGIGALWLPAYYFWYKRRNATP